MTLDTFWNAQGKNPLFAVGMTIGILILLGVLYLLREVIFLLIIACILAAALYPAVQCLNRTQNLSARLIILLFYLVFAILFLGMALLIGNLIVIEGQEFLTNLPGYTQSALEQLKHVPLIVQNQRLIDVLSGFLSTLVERAFGFLLARLNYVFVLLHIVISTIAVLIFTFFLITDTDYFERVYLGFFPKAKRPHVKQITDLVAHKIGFYVRGQVLVMALTGLLTFIGLSLVGVPYAPVLGVITALLDIFPVIGPLIAALIGIVVTLGENAQLALWAALIYFMVQQLENYLLLPFILGKSVGLHPFWILFSLLCGGLLLGVIGVLLAIPTAITFNILWNSLYQSNSNRHP